MVKQQEITIVGSGLVGSVLAIILGKRDHEVAMYERRSDIRKTGASTGRSINLALSVRGLHALRQAGVEEEVLSKSVPMHGRMIHLLNGTAVFQPYGKNNMQHLYSISRGELNQILMNAAEHTRNVSIFFNQRIRGMDFQNGVLHLHNEKDAYDYDLHITRVLASDGVRSSVRQSMDTLSDHYSTEEAHCYGYKELTILPGPDGTFRMERNVLHLWPRGTHMLLATPNHDGSFTCTLFLPLEGEVSFQNLKTPDVVEEFFRQQFPDVTLLIDNLAATFLDNPVGSMSTVRAYPWSVKDKALLIGDAAHAIVPFFGQGMNAGFEDCTIFDESIRNYQTKWGSIDWSSMFSDFTDRRKVNTDAIADMALDNFVEIHNKIADQRFLMEKKVEGILEDRFPNEYFSRYSLVAFSRVPYRVAMDMGKINEEILTELCRDLTDIGQLRLTRAKELIDQKITPILKMYGEELAIDDRLP